MSGAGWTGRKKKRKLLLRLFYGTQFAEGESRLLRERKGFFSVISGPARRGMRKCVRLAKRAFLLRLTPDHVRLRFFLRFHKRKAKEMRPLVTSPSFNGEAKLIYLHVPKTAGTSFAALCEKNYPGATSIQTNGRYDFERWTAARVVGGHFHYSCFAAADPRHVFLAVVRDPVERALSRFRWYHDRSQTRSLRKGRRLREKRGFDHESMANTLRNSAYRMEFLHDLQCRYLADCSRFRDTLEVMRSRPFIVGTFEELDRWVALVAEEFGWPHRVLPTMNRLTREQAAIEDQELLDMLRKYNREDQRLYEFVREKGVFNSLSVDHDRSVFIPSQGSMGSHQGSAVSGA